MNRLSRIAPLPFLRRLSPERQGSLLFFAAVIALGLWFGYGRVLTLGPVAHHYWRQSDGASLARNYYENGMNFFQPKMHHMVGGDNSGVAEFPILYYIVGGLYHVFGPHPMVFRLFNWSVLIGGMYLFFLVLLRKLGDPWLALFPPLLLLSSPLIAFYGPGYLPNTTALGLILAAAFLYFRYLENPLPSRFYAAVSLALLAGLLKVSILVPFLALLGAGLYSQTCAPKSWWAAHVPRWPWLIGAGLAVVAAVAAWYLWAKSYNEAHQGGYFFLIDIKPIWRMDINYRLWTNDELLNRQRTLYFTWPNLLFLAALAPALLLFLSRRQPLVLYLTLWLTLLGSVAFILLFYNQLAIHHYYFIDIMPLPALFLGAGFWVLRTHWPGFSQTWALRFLLFLLLASNVQETRRQLQEYFQPNGAYIGPEFVSLNKHRELRDFLRQHNIQYPASAVVIGDVSPNTALHYLNLRGWTISSPITDPTLDQFIQWGAQYLVVLHPEYLQQNPLPQSTAKPIGVFDGRIGFYELK